MMAQSHRRLVKDRLDGGLAPPSGRQLTIERGAEPGRHPHPAEPSVQPPASAPTAAVGVGADVLQQPYDPSPGALRPAADDPPVTPDGRADVAGAVESAALCSPRYQSRSSQPMAVGSSAGSSATHGSGRGDGSRSSVSTRPGGRQASTSTASSGQCPPDLAHGPAGPPSDVGGARPEGREPATDELGLRRRRWAVPGCPGEPGRDRRPAVLAADPRAARPAADDPALGREQEQHPGRDRLARLVGFAGRDRTCLRSRARRPPARPRSPRPAR